MNKKCANCKNRLNDPRWCRGCEYNFPGLEQFDFYQAIKHSVLMMEKDGPARTKYEDIIDCEHKDGLIVLTRINGETASFPDDGNWLMFDYTPTCGWNENPGVVPEPFGWRQVRIQLVRHRKCERSTWVDDLFLVIDAAKFDAKGTAYWENPENVENELRQVVQNWLLTKVGWEANARSSLDFNWGDLITELPIELPGIKLSGDAVDQMAINVCASFAVDQDEHLAPDAVPATLTWKDGSQATDCFVDFQVGCVYPADTNQKIPRHEAEEYLQIKSSAETTFLVHWDVFDKLYYLALEQNE